MLCMLSSDSLGLCRNQLPHHKAALRRMTSCYEDKERACGKAHMVDN